MALNTFAVLTPEAKQYYDRSLLYRAKKVLTFYTGGQMRSIPKNGGNQVSYRRFDALSLITTPMTEGLTPTSTSLPMTEITGTVQQYGNYVTYSDQIDLMAIDPIVLEATDVLGQNAGESTDAIVRAEVVTGTTILYATGTLRTQQGPSNPINTGLIRKATRTLMANDSRAFTGSRSETTGQGGTFMGIIHPNVFNDMVGDATVTAMFTYSTPDGLYNYELPIYQGVAWHVTTLAPIFSGGGASSADVYGTLVFGKDAYGVTSVAGTGRYETIVKPLGYGEDPLNQRGSIGWKTLQLPKILNNNFLVRIESGATA